ncbi:hypothetical protein F53441_817 [Fusarium austroafricanum]|uniref:Uncharacterized protein n=1 Tax=Fusarium austroafricanum TaxID=2364996 RepID=A0A8H4KWW5_9HYPO|nr:hypothetical protein F53441_817 [Fusarium austroafricanum]
MAAMSSSKETDVIFHTLNEREKKAALEIKERAGQFPWETIAPWCRSTKWDSPVLSKFLGLVLQGFPDRPPKEELTREERARLRSAVLAVVEHKTIEGKKKLTKTDIDRALSLLKKEFSQGGLETPKPTPQSIFLSSIDKSEQLARPDCKRRIVEDASSHAQPTRPYKRLRSGSRSGMALCAPETATTEHNEAPIKPTVVPGTDGNDMKEQGDQGSDSNLVPQPRDQQRRNDLPAEQHHRQDGINGMSTAAIPIQNGSRPPSRMSLQKLDNVTISFTEEELNMKIHEGIYSFAKEWQTGVDKRLTELDDEFKRTEHIHKKAVQNVERLRSIEEKQSHAVEKSGQIMKKLTEECEETATALRNLQNFKGKVVATAIAALKDGLEELRMKKGLATRNWSLIYDEWTKMKSTTKKGEDEAQSTKEQLDEATNLRDDFKKRHAKGSTFTYTIVLQSDTKDVDGNLLDDRRLGSFEVDFTTSNG